MNYSEFVTAPNPRAKREPLPAQPLPVHHIGFVVADIEAGMRGFVHSLGAEWDGRIFEDPYQMVKVAFLTTRPGEPQIELVQAAVEESPVTRFLREKGGGLHHICYQVEKIESTLAWMKSRGAILARPPKPAMAFEGRRIAWVLTAEKLLVELLETAMPASSDASGGSSAQTGS
jgi:methylmalonyl-CoA/ethylmalonyl-CoA epimerase